VRHFEQLNPARRLVYRCIECLQKLEDDRCNSALESLYGAEILRLANELLDGELRFFGVPALGLELQHCDMHQRLLAAYGKLHRQ
jgi:ribosomal protein S12 methylthiotransferase accessory factor